MRMNLSRFMAALAGLLLGVALAATAAEPMTKAQATATAVFAGGCFWCMVHPFDELPGVVSVTSGYTGGQKVNPTYQEVSAGDTGHVEAVQIVFDPKQIGYEKLLEVFWRNVDPLDKGGQFCDRGSTYQSAIFYQHEEQKRLAEQSKAAVEKKLGKTVVTAIRPAATFYAAEDYHQDYYKKNPLRYKYYRYGCGRDQRLEELWGRKV
ncbi:peptide-methionine (S)-S-oxide reductase MsrA [Sulfuricaulis sp.]|jgi:peptide-methionine (S)-S-oxide reductase|uniref:peptide-methionine (S)-S-oxide reductase MsrA n=1 Tax=Sulfuricaulis sp. TaxID=2003553 RepID=UPI00355AB8A5